MQEGTIDLDEFCGWLCEHECDVVGKPGIWFHSPLAFWLSEVTGHVYGVDGGLYGRACWDACRWLPLPQWAVLFSARVEQWMGRGMIGADALTMLADIERSLTRCDRLCRVKPVE